MSITRARTSHSRVGPSTDLTRARRIARHAVAVALGAGAVIMPLGCQPVPSGEGRYWAGLDSGSADRPPGSGGATVPPDGSGGGISPGDTGGAVGSGGGAGSGGSTGSGGDAQSGGASAATGGGSASGGMTGTGGRATGSGGRATGGAMATGGAAGQATGGSSGALTGTVKVTVTTKAAGGRYQPDNVGAIWIADANTKFVKSLLVWGSQRRRELSRWVSATSAAGLANNLVDAVTSATYSSHGTRSANWNGTDTSKALVVDGSYKVCFELEDGSSAYQCVDFAKARAAQTLMPADNTSFTKRTIEFTP